MKEDMKYTVIIPVYNAERTLVRCLDSLYVQSRSDIEVIAVNDGSKDASADILDRYAEKWSALNVVHQKNSGVSQARNQGLQLACGQYITFVDSDDCVSENYFSVLDELDDSDLGVFGSKNMDADGDIEFIKQLIQQDSFEKKLELLIASRKIMPPWNKRFKRDILLEAGLCFNVAFYIGEDFNFCMAYALHCRSIAAAAQILYHVDVSDAASLSRKYRPDLDQKMTAVYKNVAQTVRESSSDVDRNHLLCLLDYLYIKNIFGCVAENFKISQPHYWRDRPRCLSVYDTFAYRLGKNTEYVNWIHRVLRLLVRYRVLLPVYLVAYWVKGRSFQNYNREKK